MDRYWLFCYEALSADNLRDQWSVMKRKNISFIRKEIRDLYTSSNHKTN